MAQYVSGVKEMVMVPQRQSIPTTAHRLRADDEPKTEPLRTTYPIP